MAGNGDILVRITPIIDQNLLGNKKEAHGLFESCNIKCTILFAKLH